MSKSRLFPIFAAAVLVALVAANASACPTCSDAVAANSTNPGSAQGAISGGDAASGFNNAIYVTLGSLFSILGMIGTRVFLAVRRADAA